MDVVGLYPNIQPGEALPSLHKFLETRDNKQISSTELADTLTELAEVVLKNNKSEFDERLSNSNVELQ